MNNHINILFQGCTVARSWMKRITQRITLHNRHNTQISNHLWPQPGNLQPSSLSQTFRLTAVWNLWQVLLAKARPWGCLTDMSNNQSQFDSMPQTFKYFTYFWKSSVYLILISVCRHSCKHDGFLLSWGDWRHGIFVSRRNVKERDTRLPEILYNSTNQRTTSKLLKCFHFCGLANVPWAWRLRLRLTTQLRCRFLRK